LIIGSVSQNHILSTGGGIFIFGFLFEGLAFESFVVLSILDSKMVAPAFLIFCIAAPLTIRIDPKSGNIRCPIRQHTGAHGNLFAISVALALSGAWLTWFGRHEVYPFAYFFRVIKRYGTSDLSYPFVKVLHKPITGEITLTLKNLVSLGSPSQKGEYQYSSESWR
jgi:hypothetical protein